MKKETDSKKPFLNIKKDFDYSKRNKNSINNSIIKKNNKNSNNSSNKTKYNLYNKTSRIKHFLNNNEKYSSKTKLTNKNRNDLMNTCSIFDNSKSIINAIQKSKEEQNRNNLVIKPLSTDLNCYMNSLLKCLYYIKELREYFIQNFNIFTEKQPICKIFAFIMYELNYKASKYFTAEELEAITDNKNSELVNGKASDSNCLFSSLLDSFLTELSIDNNKEYSFENDFDNSNQKKMFQEVEKEIDKNNIINQLFLGYYETIYQCQKYLLKKIYSFQNEYFISFNLEKIKNYYNGADEIKISQCFEYYFRKQYNSQFYCSKCNKIEKSSYEEKIYRPPLILVLIINKGKNKIFDGIIIPEPEIDLKSYIDEKDNKLGTKYKIISIPKQYSAVCMTDSGNYSISDIFSQRIRTTQLNRDEPFLLFYRRIDLI